MINLYRRRIELKTRHNLAEYVELIDFTNL